MQLTATVLALAAVVTNVGALLHTIRPAGPGTTSPPLTRLPQPAGNRGRQSARKAGRPSRPPTTPNPNPSTKGPTHE